MRCDRPGDTVVGRGRSVRRHLGWLLCGLSLIGCSSEDPAPPSPGVLGCQRWGAIDGSGGGAPREGSSPGTCLVERGIYDGENELVISADWAPDGEYVLSGSVGEVRLLRVDRAGHAIAEVARYTGQPGRIHVEWSPDGRHAISVSTDVRLLEVSRDPPAVREIASHPGHGVETFHATWAPDGKRALTVGKDGTVRLFEADLEKGALEQKAVFTGHVGRTLMVSWAPDGGHAVTAGEDGTARLLRVDAAGLVEVGRYAQAIMLGAIGWSPRDPVVLAGTWVPDDTVTPLTVDVAAGTLRAGGVLARHGSGLRVVEWSHDGRYVLTAGHDDTPQLYATSADGRSLTALAALGCDGAGNHALSWSPDGTHFIRAASQRDRVTLVNAEACLAAPEGAP